MFDIWVARAGIAVDVSASSMLAQNGAAERSEWVMMANARALCIDAQLPEQTWPEEVQAANFPVNILSTHSVDQLTPIEKLYTALN